MLSPKLRWEQWQKASNPQQASGRAVAFGIRCCDRDLGVTQLIPLLAQAAGQALQKFERQVGGNEADRALGGVGAPYSFAVGCDEA
jgi:hypothetical protein